MKNKFVLLLCIVMAFSLLLPSFAEEAVAKEDAIMLLGILEIINGDENGNLNLTKNVTRAEFSKMLVTASKYKDNLPSNAISAGFSDVSANHWAAPYIKVASDNKWIYGYSDGSFAPSSNIKLEEAATMLLRVLEYTSSDISGVYPSGQLSLYKSLGLDLGVSAQKGEYVTREDCLYLFVNLLNAKTKSGQSYFKNLSLASGTDGKVDIYKTIADKSDGPFVIENTVSDIISNIGEYTVYRNDKISNPNEIEKYDVVYYSKPLKVLWAYSNTVTGTYSSNIISGTLPTSITVDQKSYSFENLEAAKSMSAYGEFKIDDAVTLILGREGTIVKVLDAAKYQNLDTDKYLEFIESTLSSPYIYNGNKEDYPFLNGAKLIYDLSEVSVSDLKKYDVLYYSPIANTVWIYRDAVTGKYNSASPSVSAPSSVSVGTKSYSIETSDAAYKLSFLGKFKPDDIITLILGKDGKIADVVSADEYVAFDSENYLELIESTLKGPYIVTSSYSALKLPIGEVSFTRNNKASSIDEIQKYDVVYYSETAKSVMVYGKTVSGTYTAASPSADAPTQITVAGKSYKLANNEVAISVSNMGDLVPGSLVTLLLGRNDEVAYVLPMSEYANDVYGIVIGNESKIYTDESGKSYSAKTVNIKATDGTTLSVQSNNSFYEGDIVKVSYSDKIEVNTLKTKSISGDVTDVSIGEHTISSHINILETDSAGTNPTSLFFSRLTGATLKEGDVKFYATDDEGKITDLILRDFSGDSSSYGIMLTAEDSSSFVSDDEDFDYSQTVNYIYEYQIGTEKHTLNTSSCYTYSTGPCLFKYTGGKLDVIEMLSELKDPSLVTSFGVVSKGELHLYSDSITVYTPSESKKSGLKYSTMELSELIENKDTYDIQAYVDLSAKYGGRIRLIIAKEK